MLRKTRSLAPAFGRRWFEKALSEMSLLEMMLDSFRECFLNQRRAASEHICGICEICG